MHFCNCVMDGFMKGHLGAHAGLFRNRKYPHIKTGEKLSEKLLCILLIHLTELLLSPQEAFH